VSKKPTEAPHPSDTPQPETPHPHKHPHSEPATEPESILKPIMDDLKGTTTTQRPTEDEVAPPRGPLHPPQPAPPQPAPPQPAELDQDPGGGYNPDGTYPQT
jgi:hypothetical protein